MDGLNGGNFCGKGRILWRYVTHAHLWHLWNEQNSRNFEDKFTFFYSFRALVQIRHRGGAQITLYSFVIIAFS